MSNAIAPLFETFYNDDGSLLNDGSIYVGKAGSNPEILRNQITVYWDAALTIPAAQPVKTTNGLTVRGGQPSQLYVAESSFAVVIRDKNGALVAADYAASGGSASLRADLASSNPSKGASLVGLTHGTVNDAIKYVTPEMFKTASSTDADMIEAAIATGTPVFIGGQYSVSRAINLPASNVFLTGKGTITIASGISAFVQQNTGFLFSASQIDFAGSGVAYEHQGGSSVPQTEYLQYMFTNCRFLQDNTTYAVSLTGCREGEFNFCYFENNKGVYLSKTINPEFNFCGYKNCVYGIYADLGSEGIQVNGGFALGCATVLFCVGSIAGIQLDGVMWDYNDKPVEIHGASEIAIIGGYFSTRKASNAAIFIGIGVDGTTRSKNVVITGCPNISNHGGAGGTSLVINDTDSAKIFGNNVLDWMASGINYNNCKDLSICDNQIVGGTGATAPSIYCTGTDDASNLFQNNRIPNGIGIVSGSLLAERIINNLGFSTHSAGVTTIPSGVTAHVIPHNMSIAPKLEKTSIVASSHMTGADKMWIQGVDATSITVSFDAALTAALNVNWQTAY